MDAELVGHRYWESSAAAGPPFRFVGCVPPAAVGRAAEAGATTLPDVRCCFLALGCGPCRLAHVVGVPLVEAVVDDVIVVPAVPPVVTGQESAVFHGLARRKFGGACGGDGRITACWRTTC